MSKKIMGVTVGTSLSPSKIEEKIKPIKTVNNVAPDENGNVEIEIPEGADGKTPYIQDGYWYIDGINTNVKAEGKDGKDGLNGIDGMNGKDGRNGTSVTITSIGDIMDETTEEIIGHIVNFSGGKSLTVYNGTNGKDGKDGADGEKGDKGDKGDTGAQGVQGIQGEQGEKGDKGDKGDNGTNGVNGKDGVDGKDYVLTEADKTEIADEVSTRIPFVKSPEAPTFVNSVEKFANTSKTYVLCDKNSPDDGYIFAFMAVKTEGETVPNFTNLMDDPNSYIKPGERYSYSGGGFTTNGAENDCAIVIPIPETAGAFTIRVKEATTSGAGHPTSAYFGTNNQTFSGSNDNKNFAFSDDGKGTVTFIQKVYNGGYKYFVVHVANNVDKDNLIVTLNEEITYTTTEGGVIYKWANTGHHITPADYEDRIIEVETKINEHEDRLDFLERAEINGLSLEHNSCSIFRKVVCCGDSFTAGYIGTNNDNIIQTNYDYSWVSFMARLTGNEYVNCGHSGKDVLTWQTSAKGLPRAQMAGKAQAYLIDLGLNDASLVTLGTSADIGTEAQTYYGGLSKIIRELNVISPTAKIFVQTIPSDYVVYMQYSEAMREVVNAYKDTYPVHLLDLYEYKSLYKTAKVTSDSIMGHYTAIGYQQFAENLRYVWSDYINKHISEFQDVYLIPFDETPTDLV